MAWNEPGGGGKDPWGGKGGDQGPPDLDEVVRKLQESLGGLFGGKRRGPDEPSGRSGGPGGGISGRVVGIGAAILLFVWILSGIYIIGPAERGVVLRFGAYKQMTGPGPHWRIPYPVDEVLKVKDEINPVNVFTPMPDVITAVKSTVLFQALQDRSKTPEQALKEAAAQLRM